MKPIIALLAVLLAAAPTASAHESEIDSHSYNLGIMGGFAEVVRLGVKTLALSEVMAPEEMDHLMSDAEAREEMQTHLREREFGDGAAAIARIVLG